MPPGGHLLPHQPITTIDEYLATDTGGLGVARAQEIGPAATIEMIQQSGLRGRGGGGFPTGQKWSGVAGQGATRRYLVCNGAEGEPGTFKDRALMRANPYQLVEGVIIAAFAIGAVEAYIAMKSHFTRGARSGHARRTGDAAGRHLLRLHGEHRRRTGRVPVR